MGEVPGPAGCDLIPVDVRRGLTGVETSTRVRRRRRRAVDQTPDQTARSPRRRSVDSYKPHWLMAGVITELRVTQRRTCSDRYTHTETDRYH